MREPIKEFKSQKQLDACLKEWQERLFLTDWTIRAVVVGECSDVNGKNCIATNTHNHDCKESFIEIERLTSMHLNHHVKLSHEHSLVHELLHCKWPDFRYNEDEADACVLNLHHHSLLEQISKSLIMAKYNLTFDWFKNF